MDDTQIARMFAGLRDRALRRRSRGRIIIETFQEHEQAVLKQMIEDYRPVKFFPTASHHPNRMEPVLFSIKIRKRDCRVYSQGSALLVGEWAGVRMPIAVRAEGVTA